MHFNSLSDYAESLKLITFVVVLFQVIENRKSALSKKNGHPLPQPIGLITQEGPRGHGGNTRGGCPFLLHGKDIGC